MRTSNITKKQELEICSRYKSGITTSSLMDLYNISRKKIKKILSFYKITERTTKDWSRKYTCNSNFFEKINTEDKAYWLGFLYADGCITEHTVTFSLNQNDAESLEDFKRSLNYTGIVQKTTQIVHYKGGGKNKSKMAAVKIRDSKLRQDLIKLGCVPNKSLILKFPNSAQVPENLINHFIRGYFDGDGSVFLRYTRKDGQKRGLASIVSTLDMVENIKNKLIQLCKINPKSINIHKTRNIYSLALCSRESMSLFKDFIYKDATIYLKRKYKKFQEFNFEKLPFVKEDYKDKILFFFKQNLIFNINELSKKSKLSWYLVDRTLKELLREKAIIISSTGGQGTGQYNVRYYKLNK